MARIIKNQTKNKVPLNINIIPGKAKSFITKSSIIPVIINSAEKIGIIILVTFNCVSHLLLRNSATESEVSSFSIFVSNLIIYSFNFNYFSAPWFPAGIIVFYCIYPLVFKIFFGGQKYKALYIVIFCTALAAIIVALVKFYPHLNIFTVRIPVFIIGSLFGKLVFEDYGVKIWQIILIAVLTVLSYFLFKSYPLQLGTRNLFYIFLSFSLIMALSEIYKLFAKFIPVLNVPFEFTGKISLEIYLCHEKIQEFLFRILNAFGLNVEFNQKWYQWLCIALAILLSFLINRLCSLLTRPKKDRQKTENAAQ